ADAEVFSSSFFREFLQSIDVAGRSNATQSVFAKTSSWAIGGSTKVERIIFESLRTDVFRTYRRIGTDQNSLYHTSCARFNGARRGLHLAEQYNTGTERAFWAKTEIECENLLNGRVTIEQPPRIGEIVP